MTVIELGEISSGSPGPAPWHRSFQVRDIRWPALAAALALCLLGVTGSVVPEPRGLRTLWQMPASSVPFTLTGDVLYLHTPAPALEAYDAATGRLLWRRPLDRPTDWVHTMSPGIVMLPVQLTQPDGDSVVSEVIALDSRTGRELWRRPGEPVYGDGTRLLMATAHPSTHSLTGLQMIRAADGAPLWSYAPGKRIAGWALVGRDPTRPESFAVVDDAGHVELHGTADGRPTRTGSIAWQSPVDERGGDFTYLHSTGGVLFVTRQQDGKQTVTAYDPPAMRQAWTWAADGRGGVFECGRLLCLGNVNGVRAVDPATGRAVWTSEGWEYARPLHDRRMVYETQRGIHRQGLLDPATGAIITTFPLGVVVTDGTDGDLVLLKFLPGRPADTAVYRLLGDRLELRGRMGTVTDQGCQLARGLLACMTRPGDDQTLVVKAVG